MKVWRIENYLTTNNDQTPMDYEIPVGEKESLRCMQDNYVPGSKEGDRLPAVYTIVTPTEPQHNKCQITMHGSMYEQAKDLYCQQASCTVGLLGSVYNYYRNLFLTDIVPIASTGQKVVPTSPRALHSYHLHYPALPVLQVKDKCTKVCKESTIGRIWQETCIRL